MLAGDAAGACSLCPISPAARICRVWLLARLPGSGGACDDSDERPAGWEGPSVPLPAWLRWTGVGIFTVAGGLLFWTFRSLGSNLTDTVVTRREHTLVTHGPYRWVRHPFYDCGALLIVASSLVVSNWFLLLTGGLVLVLLVVRTRTEEERLLARFGDAYRRYAERTGRFLPNFE